MGYYFTMPASDVTITATFLKTYIHSRWESAKDIIENNAFIVQQSSANDLNVLHFRLAEQINKMIIETGFVISPYDIVIITFSPATAGDADNPQGANGYFEFRVSPATVNNSAYSSGTIIAPPVANEDIAMKEQLKAWTVNGTLHVAGLTECKPWYV